MYSPWIRDYSLAFVCTVIGSGAPFFLWYHRVRLPLCIAPLVLLVFAYMYLCSGNRRLHGHQLEVQSVRRAEKALAKLGMLTRANVKIPYGNIDMVVEYAGTRFIVEIKSWSFWGGNQIRCRKALDQVRGQTQVCPGIPVIYLPAARQNRWNFDDCGVHIITGSAKFLGEALYKIGRNY